ncbi:MAG: hypothetical protein EG825_00380 [Rhodocyclaceae bacterium]|nr:hypothetical protein [Rhodocyclaceae bacterium]
MSQIITNLTADQNTHSLDDAWLGARVRGWMFDEAQGAQWWITALTRDGKWKEASFPEQTALHSDNKQLARSVVRHLNTNASHGGAWLAGWIGAQFYLLWKDRDGDFQLVEEFPISDIRLREFTLDDFAEHAEQMHSVRKEWEYNMDYGRGQRVNLAQGERLSQ